MNTKSYQSLEFKEILEETAGYALTNEGREEILAIVPSRSKRLISHLHLEIEEAKVILAGSGNVPIHSLSDVTYMIEQAKKGMFIRADQFARLVSFLNHCTKLKRFMNGKEMIAPTISLYAWSIADLTLLEEEIHRIIRHGQVDDYASSHLAKIRKQKTAKYTKLKEKIDQMTKSAKYKPLMQEKMVVEKGGRYTLPIKRESRNKVKGTVIDESSSGATIFIEPDEITVQQEELQMLKLSEEQEVEQILYVLTNEVVAYEQELSVAIDTMHKYDVIFAKAKYSKQVNGNSVVLNDESVIDLKAARHPLLGEQAIPLTITLDGEIQSLLITGPNTGGKTVTLKTVGLLSLMAQSGLHIPAAKGSSLPLFQHILVDIGDGQNIQENLSTFSSRLVNIIEVIKQANDHTLVLLDELGSGTDPGEGMGLATAILDQLADKGSTILATTHYSEMKEYANTKQGFLNAAMEFDVGTLKPTYKLTLGASGKSQAFDIALKLGLHPQIIEKAYAITYKKATHFHVDEAKLGKMEYMQQIAVNRYGQRQAKSQEKNDDKASQFQMGDNVTVQATGETAIVYKGPDKKGNYIVQIKGEKQTINHKRLKLHIPASELYPDDYDFDIIFKSKEYRKIKHQMGRKHIEGLSLDEEE
ncbi:endonuclease MutS2 [Halobacillus shinanisalinarum]|uniref:Endonuclease MutS2 n=1 Tax=Halobacillus shinanisalinarum TaxID=2932258 RepID=A0ABY4GWY7_9BACI|nr:endonuclease MutS2 [Halobacillus shinanisalinarum]UOQ92559.1 endonuclease MutS2 [Halobacillus shinanisalinarum]